MLHMRLLGMAVFGYVAIAAALASANNISAVKIQIKDNAKVTKRLVQVQSKDAAITIADAGDPATNGASLHIYSATDDFCVILPAGSNWKGTAKKIAFNDKVAKRTASIGKGKLSVTIKSGVTYSLADNGTQGAVNAQVQFGTGPRFCMRCAASKKDAANKYLAKNCVATACAPEPSSCSSLGTTTTTGSSTSSSTTTLPKTCADNPQYPLGVWDVTCSLAGCVSTCNFMTPTTASCSGNTNTTLSQAPSPGVTYTFNTVGPNGYTSAGSGTVAPDGCSIAGTFSDNQNHTGSYQFVWRGLPPL